MDIDAGPALRDTPIDQRTDPAPVARARALRVASGDRRAELVSTTS
ncbi:hypothetical protein ACQP1P_08730 [Dactylosporangium sp. CA-052675]